MNLTNNKEEKEMPFRLIFHIGAGKTGTSSIQASLNSAREQLQKSGHDYWGLMLDFAPSKLYEWQKASASKLFFNLSPEVASEQVHNVLSNSIAKAKQIGIHTAIWSNEWFFGRHPNVIPALKSIEADGVEIEIVAYVRRHDAWAKSAYVQWGVKHKTYSGPLMPFKEYIRKRPVRFAGTLQPWLNAFPNNFVLRNFDVAGDAVRDFITTLGLPDSISSIRINEAPSSEELLLRALYNNMVDGEAMPFEFERRLSANKIDFNLNASDWLSTLLPSDDDLEEVILGAEDDRDAINKMLEYAGQPMLSTESKHYGQHKFDSEKLNSALIQMLFHQSKKIHRLQHQINELVEAAIRGGIIKHDQR